MNITDPIAGMLTRIRNANSSKHKTVDIPSSNIKLGIAEILLNEGYIKSYEEIKDDVMELHTAVYDKFGYEMKYIRPPKGEYSERSIEYTNTLGYTTVMWSFAYEDWNEDKQPEEEKSKAKILNNLHNGEIMLLHGNSKTNTNILDSIIKEAKQMGYEFKSLDEFQN